MTLDASTLHLLASLIAALLGVLLLYSARQQRLPALEWWGAAYLLGAVSIACWTLTSPILGELSLIFISMGFVACGMVWGAARVFHGRAPNRFGLFLGAVVWLVAITILPNELASFRLTIGAMIVAAYAVLTARELGFERRKALQKRWLGAVPVLHGFVLILPVVVRDFLNVAAIGASNVWVTFFAIELVMYAIGTVFVVFMLVSARSVSAYQADARRDLLTGMLNRRGFIEAATRMIDRESRAGRVVSLMMIDVDHFKSMNDRFGHLAGDDILKLLAGVVQNTLRTNDLSGRIGGEEFAAIVACPLEEGMIAAERVRLAFATCGLAVDGIPVATAISVGVAEGTIGSELDAMLAAADTALYAAKNQGRNRVVAAEKDGASGTNSAPTPPTATPRRSVTVLRNVSSLGLHDPA